jgi:hypothetical protein
LTIINTTYIIEVKEMHIIRRVIMSVKSMYRIGFSYLQKSGKENNLDLDSKKFQRKANYSRKLRPNLDDFKFTRVSENEKNNR